MTAFTFERQFSSVCFYMKLKPVKGLAASVALCTAAKDGKQDDKPSNNADTAVKQF
jgi:hypothetical protein